MRISLTAIKSLLISSILIWSLAAPAENQKRRIVTSFYPMYVAVLNITENVPDVTVSNMTGQTGGCLHDYQLTPEDLKTLSKTDIFVINGAGMESFLDKIVQEKKNLKIIDASEGIELISSGNVKNPHVWVSISLHMRQVRNITAGLSKYDPENAAAYAKNAETYLKKLETLKDRMSKTLKDLKTRDIITFHEAFPYFAKEFGLKIAAVVEREPGSEPDAREMAHTIDLIRKSKVKILFAEPQYSSKSAETISRETDAKLYILDPAVSGPLEANSYLDIMGKNLEVLGKALK